MWTGAQALGAVLLAGGESRRFGFANKLLAQIDGTVLIEKLACEIADSGVADLVVVTGAEADATRSALQSLPVRFVHNDNWGDGMGGSVAVGIASLSPALQGAFVVPGDMPRLTAGVFRRLAEAFAVPAHPIVVPITREGAQRNPVLWPRRHFSKLAALAGPQGGKSLLDTLADERLDVAFEDESVFVDIDTADDYARFIAGAPK